MTTETVFIWAAHNILTAAAIGFGGATLIILLYTYVHDYATLVKHN
jgi:hypothetical protein